MTSDTDTVARDLGVPPRQLRAFVDHHPDPRAGVVIRWADAEPADVDHDAVERWIDDQIDTDRDPLSETERARANAWLNTNTDTGEGDETDDETDTLDPEGEADGDGEEKPGLLSRLLPDGGRTPAPGERVRDRDDGDGAELVVVEVSDDVAEEHYLDAIDASVAEVNPSYPARATVVRAVYLSEVDASVGDWRSVDDLRKAGVTGALTVYAFPADRLAPVEEVSSE